ncbi:MAG: flagellar biosynthesis protein FlhF [Holophagaceae bacterium]|nr:flagellar biosynthesis protein FlhF [Holophagaceae bacterium]
MRVKTFEAASMQDALETIKREMGEEAFILSTKTRKNASGASLIEVTAAVDEAQAPVAPEPAMAVGGTYGLRPPLAGRAQRPVPTDPPMALRSEGAPVIAAPAPAAPSRAPLPPPPPPPVDLQPLRRELLEIKGAVEALKDQESKNASILRELDQLKAMLSRIQKQGMPQAQLHLPPSLLELYGDLVGNDVDSLIALRLCEYTQRSLLEQCGDETVDPEKARLFMRRVIANFIPVAAPIQLDPGKMRVAALVGPTGVGKTTTIAKLAAYAKLELKQKVALLTLDTFRLAAVDQLQQYAQILQVPIHVALTVEDLRSALRFYQDRALVLIDTPGHNPKDTETLGQLRRFLDELPEVETHLVLSATTKPKDLADLAQRFEPLKPGRIIFTKLDETSTFGPILSTLVRVKRPLSYLGTGQEVPQDLEMATSRRVADLILPAPQVNL